MIKEAIAKLVEGRDLTLEESKATMNEIMEGLATPSQIAAFLVALRMKGETVEEIAALASVMIDRCIHIHPGVQGRIVDLCGTGGAPFKTFNVSTISSFVVAAAGAPVAKHGNRSSTSSCGSADLLETLGVKIDLEPHEVERIMNSIGICFMFALKFHPAMKYAVLPRREIGLRTVFNILGPLTNPAGAKGHLLGVFSPDLVERISRVLSILCIERALVVHGYIGSDEISSIGKTMVCELNDGEISRFEIDPLKFGMKWSDEKEIRNTSPLESAKIALEVLNGVKGPRLDMVLLNSAAALMVAGLAENLEEGIELARESIESGSAMEKLRQLLLKSGGDVSRLEEIYGRP